MRRREREERRENYADHGRNRQNIQRQPSWEGRQYGGGYGGGGGRGRRN
jgi:hypothetical protein